MTTSKSSYILEASYRTAFRLNKTKTRYNTLKELKKELNKLYYTFELMTCKVTHKGEVIDFVDLIED